ncbi:MAG: D-alanine--D-alanine ligase [Deltaproteobacteria bacterium]|nr:D-alanine--D-alanine ligase [Deltaproteobacteria bacterium]
MNEKIKVGILFGGKSAEHEISIMSAKNIIAAIDRDKYQVFLIGITKKGKWCIGKSAELMLEGGNATGQDNITGSDMLALVPGESDSRIVSLADSKNATGVDVIFPVLHGPMGEDGTVQGLLKLAGIPFVGSGVLGSAAGMDKDVMKRLFRDRGIPIGKFKVILSHEKDEVKFDDIVNALGLPLFIKPANMGSSVGVHKVGNKDEFDAAISDAFNFDSKILVEEFIKGREIECAVLGNENPIASVPGEICTQHDFYSYNAKYVDENGAVLNIPANLPEDIKEKIKKLAIESFKCLCCEGLARVDSFLKEDGTIIVNEVNTIPGFTSISMYPMLFKESGIEYSELIDRLISLALDRYEKEKMLKSDYSR